MKRFISFGSIDQFRQVVRDMSYHGSPVVTAHATEKVHGTNAAVCWSPTDGMWVQSRNNIIDVDNDNAGCARFVMEREDFWKNALGEFARAHGRSLATDVVTIYFEFAGGNIQKNSCLSGLDKHAIVFEYGRFSGIEDEVLDTGHVINSSWARVPKEAVTGDKVRSVLDFPTWEMVIDFTRPAEAQNALVDLVDQVESQSPLGAALGVQTIGEGVVVQFFYKDRLYRFKAKGEKHSVSKVKKLTPVDAAKEKERLEFANYATPAWRLEQAWQTVFGIDNEKMEPSIKATGDFLRAVVTDVMKEESDVLAERDLTPKEVNGLISKIARTWFMEQIDTF